jgi:hypothetical protein
VATIEERVEGIRMKEVRGRMVSRDVAKKMLLVSVKDGVRLMENDVGKADVVSKTSVSDVSKTSVSDVSKTSVSDVSTGLDGVGEANGVSTTSVDIKIEVSN